MSVRHAAWIDFHDQQVWLALALAIPVWAVWVEWLQPLGLVAAPLPGQPWVWLSIVVIYPVAEELVFRGALQGYLLQTLCARFGPVSAANLVTTFVFAALHLLHGSAAWAMLIIVPSLIFGYFRERSGGVSTPILLHGFYNAGFVLLATSGWMPQGALTTGGIYMGAFAQ